MPRKTLFIALLVVILASLLGACGAKDDMPMAPLSEMPMEVQQASVSVQQAYQFAAANPEIAQQVPCYCGCGAMGHTSVYSCYVKEVGPDGAVVFDSHAQGCSICVEIAQDAMRMTKEGKPAAEIKAYVDATYSPFGPSNMDQ